MKVNKVYDYNITIQYILNNKSYDLKSASIRYIMVDYNYITANMPIVYCGMAIDLSLYKTIINNENNGKFLLIIKKNEENSNAKISYIKAQFKYFIPSNRNEWNTEFVNKSGDETTANQAYKETVVGLMSESMINDNSKIFGGVYTNTTSASIVHMCTKHIKKLVIEQFKHNYKIDSEFIIPPMESVKELLEFLNDNYPFYDTPYRYFLDFNQAYIISSDGKYIDKGDDEYKTINIDIQNRIVGDLDKGMVKDTDNNCYYISTYLTRSVLKVNIYLESILNTLNTIDIYGTKNEEILDLLKENDITKHYKFQRIINMDSTTQIKKNIENSIVTLGFSKANIDTSIITPNKVYSVNNFEDNKQYNGRYILSRKQEMFLPNEDKFGCVTSIELKRIKNT